MDSRGLSAFVGGIVFLGGGCAAPRHSSPAPVARSAPDAPRPEELRSADRRAILGAPLLDLRHECVGFVFDLLVESSSGAVGQAVLESSAGAQQGIFLPLSQWIWDPAEHRFLLRLTRSEVESLDLRRTPLAALARMVDGDPVPLEEDPLETRELERFSGTVTQVEDDSGRFLFFELRDPENHFRRVYLAPRSALASAPAVGDDVSVEGVPTRDERGALWVAAGIRIGDERIELRDASGRVPWPGSVGTIASRWLSARNLVGERLQTSDGHGMLVEDAWIDATCERVAFLLLRSDEPAGESRAVPWSAFSLEAEGPLRTTWTREEIHNAGRAGAPPGCLGLVGAILEVRSD